MGMIGGPGQRKYHSVGVRDLEWWERVGFIERPDALVKKASGLLESERWEEVVVGLSVLTGRCLAEVLKTGVMYPKTRYMVWYTTYQEQVDLVWGPFEVPTLVEAERVLVAWSRVRRMFTEGEGVQEEESAQDICEQYRWRVSACAKEHFERRVPVDEHRDWYAPLYLCIYPLIATWYYCPTWKQPRWYAEKIRGYDWLAQKRDEGEQKPHCAGCIRECSTYAVGNGVNNHAGGQGLKLGQEGVELLEGIGKQEEGEALQERCAGMEEAEKQREPACAAGSVGVMNEQGSVDDRQGIRLEETDVEVIAVFQQADVSIHQMSSREDGSTRAPDMQETDRKYERRYADSEIVTCEQEGVEAGMTIAQLDVRTLEEADEVTEKKKSIKQRQRSSEREQSLEDHLKKDIRHQKQMDRSAQPKALAMEWLGQRWKWFVIEMADFVVEADEEEMRVRCEEEMEAWRTYCEETKHMSFQEMVMRTRVALRTSIPAPQNEWWNPDAEEWEHIGLKYFQCSAAEWEQMRLSWLEDSMLLAHPEQIVARAIGMLSTGLMEAEAWPQLVVGIAVLTGQGLLRILKTGCFSQKTAFSLLFRDAFRFNSFLRDEFELPTLGRADLVVEAWECVRERVDCTQMDAQELLHRYGQRVGEVASASFRDLVPLPAGATDHFFMLSHCVYPCLATHYYCPTSIKSVDYLAQICHEPLLLVDPSPDEHFACAAVCNYLEYRLADERKGIWLDQIRQAERCADYEVVEVEFDEEEIAELDDIRQQMGFDRASAMMDRYEVEDAASGEASGTLKLSITLCNQELSPTLYEFIRLGLEHLRGDFAEFVSVSLREEMLAGLKLQQPFKTMLSSELRKCDHPQATYELSRRTIITVMRYNQSISNPALRWYLNEDIIFHLIQKSRFDIRWCLDDHQQEIEQHHQIYHLTAVGNVKPVPVTEVIHLQDDPHVFQGVVLRG